MKRFASVRFDAVLATLEREEAARAVGSAGASLASWSATATRTYATVVAAGDTLQRLRAALPHARVDVPALAVLRVRPDQARLLPRLEDALGGPGRPAGIIAAYSDPAGLVIELDVARSRIGLVLATIDAELAGGSGRTIEALVGLDDDTLAALAGDLLGTALDAACLLETHLAAALEDLAA